MPSLRPRYTGIPPRGTAGAGRRAYKATCGDLTSATITSWLLHNASVGYVTGNPAGTPNRVLYKAAM
ncbi:MAG TPA: hypothetical protein VK358_01160 [Longimicrobium sp.]|nr:hypothetical protein [Longimicrobium sp.]